MLAIFHLKIRHSYTFVADPRRVHIIFIQCVMGAVHIPSLRTLSAFYQHIDAIKRSCLPFGYQLGITVDIILNPRVACNGALALLLLGAGAEAACIGAGGTVVRLAGLYSVERGPHNFWLGKDEVREMYTNKRGTHVSGLLTLLNCTAARVCFVGSCVDGRSGGLQAEISFASRDVNEHDGYCMC